MSGDLRGCDQIVTIWNRFLNPETGKEEFVRHVLPVLCMWKTSVKRGEYRNEAVRTAKAASAGISQNLSVIVPFSDKYKPYALWVKMNGHGKKQFFTLRVADLVAKGAHKTEITGVTPFTETEVKSALGGDCAVISAFEDNTGGGKAGAHFKVGCFYGFRSW